MSLTLGLGAATSGLLTAQKGLDLVSHNIANVNTPGYTRKDFNPVSRVLYGNGVGVEINAPSRNVQDGILRDLRREGAMLNKLQSLDDYYARLQDLFGAPDSNNSVSHIIETIGAEMESLAVNPSKSTHYSMAVDAAVNYTEKLHGMSNEVQELRKQVDVSLADSVARVNDLLGVVADLNNKIVRDKVTIGNIADLEDKRDLALQQLSELLEIQVFTRENGASVVFTTSGTSLIDNSAVAADHVAVTNVSPWQTKAGDGFTAITVNGIDITSEVRQGRIKGLLELRDGVLPDLQSEMDELAKTMRDEVNTVHNRGTSHPEMNYSVTGTRRFIDSGTQAISLTGGAVRMVLTNRGGAQVASGDLSEAMVDAGEAANGPWTIDAVASGMQTWLRSNGAASATVAVGSDGKFAINLNDRSLSLNFRDQATATVGDTAEDATVAFDADGDGGVTEESVSGFSNFLGLNDFFIADRTNWIWESAELAQGLNVGVGGTLNFSDTSNGINFASLTVALSDTIEDIADHINQNATLSQYFKAEVVPEGGNQRLRVKSLVGDEMAIAQTGGTTVLDALGIRKSTVGLSNLVTVRSDIVVSPQKIARGAVEYSTDLAAYFVSTGDNRTANQLADIFTEGVSFDLAGKLSGTERTFADYAATILAQNANEAANVKVQMDYQKGLHGAMKLKSDEYSAVNLDEELAKLMIYQQAYTASAKVIQTTQAMLEVLTTIIR